MLYMCQRSVLSMGLCSCRAVRVPMLTPDPYTPPKQLHWPWSNERTWPFSLAKFHVLEQWEITQTNTGRTSETTQSPLNSRSNPGTLSCEAAALCCPTYCICEVCLTNTWTAVSIDAQYKYKPLFLNCRRCWIVCGAQNLSWAAHSTSSPLEQGVWRRTAGSFPAEPAQNLASEIRRHPSLLTSSSNRL